MKQAVLVAFGWSADHTSPISQAILFMTRRGINPLARWAQWSHMFLVFEFDDGSRVIHEALMSDGWREKPSIKLVNWKKKDPMRHLYTVKWLPIDQKNITLIYQASCAWLGAKSYARRQLLAFAIAESMLGRWLGLGIAPGPNEVICSEGACRLVGSICPAWDLRAYADQPWDSVTPQGAYDRYLKLSSQ